MPPTTIHNNELMHELITNDNELYHHQKALLSVLADRYRVRYLAIHNLVEIGVGSNVVILYNDEDRIEYYHNGSAPPIIYSLLEPNYPDELLSELSKNMESTTNGKT